jgi:hypothetical protein
MFETSSYERSGNRARVPSQGTIHTGARTSPCPARHLALPGAALGGPFGSSQTAKVGLVVRVYHDHNTAPYLAAVVREASEQDLRTEHCTQEPHLVINWFYAFSELRTLFDETVLLEAGIAEGDYIPSDHEDFVPVRLTKVIRAGNKLYPTLDSGLHLAINFRKTPFLGVARYPPQTDFVALHSVNRRNMKGGGDDTSSASLTSDENSDTLSEEEDEESPRVEEPPMWHDYKAKARQVIVWARCATRVEETTTAFGKHMMFYLERTCELGSALRRNNPRLRLDILPHHDSPRYGLVPETQTDCTIQVESHSPLEHQRCAGCGNLRPLTYSLLQPKNAHETWCYPLGGVCASKISALLNQGHWLLQMQTKVLQFDCQGNSSSDSEDVPTGARNKDESALVKNIAAFLSTHAVG